MPAKKRASRPFVKAQDTDVPVERSREDIRALLKRYGAVGFGVQEDYAKGRVAVSFVLPAAGGGHVPIQIPIDIGRVYAAMYEQRKGGGLPHSKGPDAEERHEQRREQAERTAWRQLYLIIDATLTAVQLGMMSISDVFLAHTMVVSEGGRSERMADYLARVQGALSTGVRALLPNPEA
jgi:hypothetical protein